MEKDASMKSKVGDNSASTKSLTKAINSILGSTAS